MHALCIVVNICMKESRFVNDTISRFNTQKFEIKLFRLQYGYTDTHYRNYKIWYSIIHIKIDDSLIEQQIVYAQSFLLIL